MRRGRSRSLMVVSLAAVLALIGLRWSQPGRWLVSRSLVPVGGWLAAGGRHVGGTVGLISSVRQISTDNGRLRAENATLRTRLSEDAELRVQNDSLRRQLSFAEVNPQRLIPATVVAYQPDNFRGFITINRGSRDGLRDGMAVISEGSLVGTITQTGQTSAKVFLVIDPEFRVNGLDQQTRATGTVRGQLGQGLIMEKIATSDVIKPGDAVITSGLGGELPKGVVIGQVESIDQKDVAVFQTARLTSNLRFGKLELVFVVVRP